MTPAESLKKMLLAIPVVETPSGDPVIRITDFNTHYDELVLKILPTARRIIVTSHGKPIFEVKVVADFEKVEYTRLTQETRFEGITQRGNKLYAQKSSFNRHRTELLRHAFELRGAASVTITWRGWPDWQAVAPRMSKSVRHMPVALPAIGQRGEGMERKEDAKSKAG